MNIIARSLSKLLALFILLMILPLPAEAHWGHLGELAGHSHVIGLGALVVAGLVASLVVKLPGREKEDSEAKDQENCEDDESTIEGEQPA